MRAGCIGVVLGLVLGAGCTGAINAVPQQQRCGDPAPLGTKLVRLTHGQYDNSVRDLFGLDVYPSREFRSDPTFSGFDNNAKGLQVDDRLGRDYRRAAETLAEQVAADPSVVARIVPCAPGSDGCARKFVESFGRRAYRRPLTDTEKDTLVALFDRGVDLYDSGDAFTKGVRIVVEAMLQSPNFLYRTETDAKPVDARLVRLSAYEVASRLSYTFWNTTPDETLLAAAAAGELDSDEQVRAQALRMLDDPRAALTVDDFHAQWLDTRRFDNLQRDASLYPNFSSGLGPALREETLRFARSVVLEDKAGYEALMTAPYTFVNQELAALYRLPGTFDASFRRVDLDPTQRAGLLTQLGFLASHSYMRTDSPIHRGVFIIRRVLCLPQADPPGNADLNLPPLSGSIKTTRQQVEAHTSPPTCNSCHQRINSMGFAFENYDAVGQWRTTENGEPVDATGSVLVGNQRVSFSGGVDFIRQISALEEARSCYSINWLRYAYGRADELPDRCEVEALERRLADPAYSIRDFLADLTTTRGFLYRPIEEKP